MKKLMLGMLSAFMLLTFTPISASGSISEVTTPGNATNEKGEEVVVKVDEVKNDGVIVTDKIYNQVQDLNSGKQTMAQAGIGNIPEGATLATKIVDLSVDPSTTGKVTVEFQVNAGTEGKEFFILHFDGSNWEFIPATIKDSKTIVCTFTKFSPVGIVYRTVKTPTTTNNDKPTSKPASGYDDGGPFTTDACGNVFDRWGNEIYHAPVCVNNNAAAGNTYTFVNTSDR